MYEDIEYPKPEPRYLCRIHGNSPCSSACRGKQPDPASEEPAWKRSMEVGGRRAGKSAAMEAYRQMRELDPFFTGLWPEPEVPMHWLEPTEVMPLCTVRGTMKPRNVECRTTRNTGEVTCRQCIDALAATHCRHRGGAEDCGPLCLLLFGECYYTEMVEVPRLGDRPEDVKAVPGQPKRIIRTTEDLP